ncbi:MAG: DUF4231 domain-containing protein [Actinomycetota bacterium]|nr:DUF4231 domain-containing protein [Actinomycetota bacterium]
MENKTKYFDSEKFAQHPAWLRLNNQLDWYDRKSGENQKRYKQIKVAQLILAASIPIFALAGATWGKWVTAILGASVAILEGLQQLGQYNNLWVSYRATAEQLKHEKFLFLAKSGAYRDLGDEEALKRLAERIEERVSIEHAKWVSELSRSEDQQEQQGER